jgi:hypothetical protein
MLLSSLSGFSSYSLSLVFISMGLLISGGIMLPCFFISCEFLHLDFTFEAKSLIGSFCGFFPLKSSLLAYIICTGEIHCDISEYAYIVHWLGSPPPSLSLIPLFSYLKQLQKNSLFCSLAVEVFSLFSQDCIVARF